MAAFQKEEEATGDLATKQKLRGLLACAFGIMAVISLVAARVNEVPELYLMTIAMVLGIVSMIVSIRRDRQQRDLSARRQ